MIILHSLVKCMYEKTIWFVFENLLIILTHGRSWKLIQKLPCRNPCRFSIHDYFFGPLGLHLLVWSELNGLGIFNQWEILECNGYEPSILHLEWPSKACSRYCRWPVLIQSWLWILPQFIENHPHMGSKWSSCAGEIRMQIYHCDRIITLFRSITMLCGTDIIL